jgi:pimeloyl-ACP methyl ester carboxylesterase
LIFIVDGTGPDDFSDYHADMSRGFCWSLWTQNKLAASYLRGPNELGLETWEIADLMYADVQAQLKAAPNTEIVLAGHSRGGSAVIHLARKLQRDKIEVRAMVLFDAVRRALQKSVTDYARQISESFTPAHLAYNAVSAVIEIGHDFFQIGSQEVDIIPGNVKRALHVVRDEQFSNYFLQTDEYRGLQEGARSSTARADDNMAQLVRMRQMHRRLRDACRFDCIKLGVSTGFSFYNTGLKAEAGCKLTIERFPATHGAMGGAPLEVRRYIADPRYAADIESREITSMLAVQARVNAFLAEVNMAVRSGQEVRAAQLAYVPSSRSEHQSLTAIRPRR